MVLMERKLRYEGNRFFKLYHLCYYFSKSNDFSAERKLILDFKKGDENALRHFSILALKSLEGNHIDDDVFIIRALHSNELKVTDRNSSPLDRLGDSLATVFDCTYYPKILTKTNATQPVKSLSLIERKIELDNVYQIDTGLFDLNERKIIIIDDIVTTGTTASYIIDCILKEFPRAKINVFSLAWTPTLKQQLYIQKREKRGFILNEPEIQYGRKSSEWVDTDFENGETNVSYYP